MVVDDTFNKTRLDVATILVSMSHEALSVLLNLKVNDSNFQVRVLESASEVSLLVDDQGTMDDIEECVVEETVEAVNLHSTEDVLDSPKSIHSSNNNITSEHENHEIASSPHCSANLKNVLLHGNDENAKLPSLPLGSLK